MKILVTGHTGFKGSWLTVMLKQLGHEVHGIALNPKEKSLFKIAEIKSYLSGDHRVDIRNQEDIRECISLINPDVLIHLAAQPLVRLSFSKPIETFDINVMGTINILESTRLLTNLKSTLIITTDKVYKNVGKFDGYRESDQLGGKDPYSASKAAADIATQSWRESFGKFPIAIARAGNVIGGGDWAQDRLIPDLVNAISTKSKIKVRYPHSIRPWQHVLDCLNGYITLINKQLNEGVQGEWNFGPSSASNKTVTDVLNAFSIAWNSKLEAEIITADLPEAPLLTLDSSKSESALQWFDRLDFESSIEWTSEWYKHFFSNSDMKMFTEKQVCKFLELF